MSEGNDFVVVSSDSDLSVVVYDDDISVVVEGSIGVNGKDGAGVIPGGFTGQILAKKTSIDFDTEWHDPTIGIPVGGDTGQVLTKADDTNYNVLWVDVPPGVPAGGDIGYILSKASASNYDMSWIPGINPADFIAKAGDTMTGPLTLAGAPVNDLEAATKLYVDTKTGLYLPLIGGALSNFLTLHSDPIDIFHAATKQYVDNSLAAKAPLNSPVFTGDPQAPTPPAEDNDTSIATTAFVNTKVGLYLPLTGGTLTGPLGITASLNVTGGNISLIRTGSSADLILSSESGSAQIIWFKTGSLNRWRLLKTLAAVDDLALQAYDDAGTTQNSVFTIARATRILTFTVTPLAPTPTAGDNSTKLATTAFVTTAIAGAGTGSFLPLAGGTLTGPLTLSGAPTLDLHASTKKYVDDGLALKAPITSPAFLGGPTAPTPSPGDNSTKLATTAFVTSEINTFSGAFLPLSGGTVTGPLTVKGLFTLDHVGAGTDADLFMAVDSGASALFRFRTGAADRWRIGKDDQPEAGSNSGSDFILKTYNDAGSNFSVLNIPRATQVVAFAKTPTAPTPTAGDNSTQLATTEFVNTKAANYLALAGGVLTGFLTLHADPSTSMQAATKQYVDNTLTMTVGAYLPLAGGTLSGALTLSGITPTADHAVKKSYVDTGLALKANLSGATFTGNIETNAGQFHVNRVGDATDAYVTLSADAGRRTRLLMATGAIGRWVIDKTLDAESGSEAGSNFAITAFSDAGTPTTALTISRATRIAAFTVSPTAPTPTAGDATTKLATTAFVDASFAKLTGATFTGAVAVSTGSLSVTGGNIIASGGNIQIAREGDAAEASFYLNTDATWGAFVYWRTGTSSRWRMGKHTVAESGGDVGSDFYLTSYTDAGVTKTNVLTIARSTGIATFSATPVAPTATAGDSSTKLATTAFVATAIAGAVTGGVPAGGTANQVLAKVSSTNYDMAWVDPAGAGTFLAISGGTMTGPLTLSGAPTVALHAATMGYVDAADALKANLTGATFTGTVTAPNFLLNRVGAALSASFDMRVDAGFNANIDIATGTSRRWRMGKESTAESGSNAGSNFALSAWSDAGTLLAEVFSIVRATQVMTFTQSPIAPTPTAGDSSTKLATTVFVSTADALKANLAGGNTFTGIQTFSTEVIVPTPTLATHAATKGYVDTQDALKASLAGAAFTGAVSFAAAVTVQAPTTNSNPATKLYVDTELGNKAPLASPTFTGDPKAPTPAVNDNDTSIATTAFVTRDFLKLAGGTMTGNLLVLAPTVDAHAATKLYVDTQVATRATPAYVDAGLALKANLAGAAFTGAVSVAAPLSANSVTSTGNIATTGGSLTVDRTGDAAQADLLLIGDATVGAFIHLRSGANNRWRLGKTLAEDFIFNGYDNAGASVVALNIARLTGVVTFSAKPIAPTPAPGTNNTELATTAFVVSAIAGGGSFLPSTGGTLTGPLTMSGASSFITLNAAPTSDLHAATKKYVDDNVTLKSNLAGGNTFTGDQLFQNAVQFDSGAILPALAFPYPTVARHAAHKAYVDQEVATKVDAAYVTAAIAGKANLSGATFTGNVTTSAGYFQVDRIGDGTPAEIWITSDVNQQEHITFRVGATNRWRIGKTNNAEGGTANGADFAIEAYNNAGASLGVALSIARSSKIVDFNQSPTLPTPAEGDITTTKGVNALFVSNYYLQKSGGTMTGKLVLTPAQQTGPNDAAYIGMISSAVSDRVLRSGDSMTGTLNMTTHSITNVSSLGMVGAISMNGFDINDVNGIVFNGVDRRIINLNAPQTPNEPMRPSDYVRTRPQGNNNFSDWDVYNTAAIGWTTPNLVTNGGIYGDFYMRIDAVNNVLESQFQPVDPDDFWELTARFVTNAGSPVVSIGLKCFAANKVTDLGNIYPAVQDYPITGTVWRNVGGVVRGEGSINNYRFPTGTRYVKRLIAVGGTGSANFDHVTLRQFGKGEPLNAHTFGLRAGGNPTYNTLAIRKIFDYLVQFGGLCLINPGTFDFDGNVTLASNNANPPFELRGSGRYTTILKRVALMASNIFQFDRVDRFTISDIGFNMNSLNLPGTIIGDVDNWDGLNFGHTIGVYRSNYVTLKHLYLDYGSSGGTQVYISSGNPVSDEYDSGTFTHATIDDVIVDGRDESANGILIGQMNDSIIKNSTAYRVRSILWPNYTHETEGLVNWSSPAMGIQFKHACLRAVMENCAAIDCRMGVSFTGTDEPGNSENCRATGLTIEMGTGSYIALNIDDSRYGTFTGIHIDGNDIQPEAGMGGLKAVSIQGVSKNNYVEANIHNMYAGGDQNSTSWGGRVAVISDSAIYNHIHIPTLANVGTRPIMFTGTVNYNLVTFGVIEGLTALPTNYGLKGSSAGTSNYLRMIREDAWTLRAAAA